MLFSLFLASALTLEIPAGTKKAFELFKRQFQVDYKSAEEETFRLGVFHANLADIEEKNQRAKERGSSARYGVNHLTDLTHAEFKAKYLMPPVRRPAKEDILRQRAEQGVDHAADVALPVAGTPGVIDWTAAGAVTAVKNQGQCGSCWAFSATEEIESQLILRGDATNTTIALSEQQIVDCSTADLGCGGGRTEDAYNFLMSFGGIESNATYPYTAKNGVCKDNKSKIVAKVRSYNYATTFWSQSTLLKNLAQRPVSVCLDAASWQHYKSGVLTSWECDGYINIMDHCVQLTGANQVASEPYYIVRNSWTTNWGIKGYIHLALDTYNTCGILNDATMVHVAK